MRRTALVCALACAFVQGSTLAPALADEDTGVYSKHDWPLEAIRRPLTLAASMLEIRGDTLRINLSDDAFAEPISVAPDIYFGVTDLFTVGVTHETGICLTGEDGGCARSYDDIGLDAIYALMRAGTLQVAAHGGLVAHRFSDPFAGGLRAGLRTRIVAGKVAVIVDPTLDVELFERDLVEDFLRVPVDVQYQLEAQTMIFVSSGVEGPLDGFGDGYRIPLGLGILFAVNERLDVGAELRLGNAAGQDATIDERWLFARAALRL